MASCLRPPRQGDWRGTPIPVPAPGVAAPFYSKEMNVIVRCEKCDKVYDDFYRLTYCPHEKFAISESAAAATRAYAEKNPDFMPMDDPSGYWVKRNPAAKV